jgi:peptidoglycan/xylan/chitin deacetylase (PgdA/CDA1 family)
MQLLAVNYHYFRDTKPKSGIYPLTFKEFENQIDELSKYYQFISQKDLLDKLNKKNSNKKNYCLLTFDDGLKEQMKVLEILNKKGIPAIFYVTTNSIKNSKVVDVHKLHYIRSIMDDIEVYKFISKFINIDEIKFPDNIKSLYRYDSLDTKKLKYLLNFILDKSLKNKIIDEIFLTLTNEKEFSKKLYMSIDDIKKLHKFGYLGTHSDLHLPLATLSKEEIKNDINNSLDFLYKDCAISNIDSISYPYGGVKAVDEKVIEVSKDIGFRFGLTMFRGINDLEDLKNPLMLKRVDTNDAPGGKLKSEEFCL